MPENTSTVYLLRNNYKLLRFEKDHRYHLVLRSVSSSKQFPEKFINDNNAPIIWITPRKLVAFFL